MLILTQYIVKHEFSSLSRYLNLNELIDGAKKVQKGLGIHMKSLQKEYAFYKVRIGKRNGARMIVFMITENQKVVPILIRLKKDKIFGMNMAMNNPKVTEQINKNLSRIIEDIENHRFEEFPTS